MSNRDTDVTVRGSSISNGTQSCIKDIPGRVAVVLAYVLFSYMYTLTLFYGIWHNWFFTDDGTNQSIAWPIVSTVAFSILFSLMMLSHILSVMTDPGTMPKEYERLYEVDLPFQFYDLIRERESIYVEHIVKKKLRKGEIP